MLSTILVFELPFSYKTGEERRRFKSQSQLYSREQCPKIQSQEKEQLTGCATFKGTSEKNVNGSGSI